MSRETSLALMSKDLESIQVQNEKKGLAGKLFWPMYFQMFLTIYYIATWPVQLGLYFNYYYVCTTDDNTTIKSINETANDVNPDFVFVRSDVSSFQCKNKIFHLEGTGPHPELDSSLKLSSNKAMMLFEPGTKTSDGFITGMAVTILFAYVSFVVWHLYKGQYNMVMHFVSFTKEQPKKPKPVKFGVGFTLMCNLAAGYGNFMMQNECGYMVQGPSETFAKNPLQYILPILFAVAFIGLNLWIYTWLLSCGSCVFRFENSVLLIRPLLAMGVSVSYIIRLVNLRYFALHFDFSFPVWSLFSIVCAVDLVVSTAVEIYLGGCCFYCCSSSEQEQSLQQVLPNLKRQEEDVSTTAINVDLEADTRKAATGLSSVDDDIIANGGTQLIAQRREDGREKKRGESVRKYKNNNTDHFVDENPEFTARSGTQIAPIPLCKKTLPREYRVPDGTLIKIADLPRPHKPARKNMQEKLDPNITISADTTKRIASVGEWTGGRPCCTFCRSTSLEHVPMSTECRMLEKKRLRAQKKRHAQRDIDRRYESDGAKKHRTP